MLGARTSPSPGSADLVTSRASQKPPAEPQHSPSLAKAIPPAQLQGLLQFSVAFLQQTRASSQLFVTAAGPNPARSCPWERCLSRGDAALAPLLAVLCPRSRRTTNLAIISEGQKFLFMARIPSGPAKPDRLGQARPQGTTGSSQPPRSCLSLSALGDRMCPAAPGFTPNSAE